MRTNQTNLTVYLALTPAFVSISTIKENVFCWVLWLCIYQSILVKITNKNGRHKQILHNYMIDVKEIALLMSVNGRWTSNRNFNLNLHEIVARLTLMNLNVYISIRAKKGAFQNAVSTIFRFFGRRFFFSCSMHGICKPKPFSEWKQQEFSMNAIAPVVTINSFTVLWLLHKKKRWNSSRKTKL